IEIGIRKTNAQVRKDLEFSVHLHASPLRPSWKVDQRSSVGISSDLIREIRVKIRYVNDGFALQKRELHTRIPTLSFFGREIGVRFERREKAEQLDHVRRPHASSCAGVWPDTKFRNRD